MTWATGARAAAAATLLALLSIPALAEDSDLQWKWCAGGAGISADQSIRGCTARIESGAEPVRHLADAFARRGIALVSKGELDRAMRDFDEAIRLYPSFARPFSGRGALYGRMGQFDRAIQDLDQAINLDAGAPINFYNRGFAYASKGEHVRAIEDYDQVIRLIPSFGPAFTSRCASNTVAGRLDAALKDCNEAARLLPNNGNMLRTRGLLHLTAGRFDQAIADYDAALRLDAVPRRDAIGAGTLYSRGVARLRKGDKAEGEADIAAAIAIKADIAQDMAKHGVRP